MPSRGIDEIQDIFAGGQIAKLRIPPGNDDIINWSLDDWERRYGSTTIQVHRLHPKIWQTRTLPENAAEIFQNAPVSLTDLITRLREFSTTGTVLIPPWWDDTPAISVLERMELYGAVNTKRLPKFEFRMPWGEAWAEVFNFVWFGASSGGLHYDGFDNTLFQIKGTKVVLLFDVRLTDVVDGRHYPRSFDSLRPLSQDAVKHNRYLEHLPYHIVELGPGDGITIPARAYHAPFATSFDSISVNGLLVPRLSGRPAPFDVRARSRSLSFDLKASRKIFALTGKTLRRAGPYEFV
ncbi:MAG: cupin-like domain-containing protein [Acidobacteriota bacterium]